MPPARKAKTKADPGPQDPKSVKRTCRRKAKEVDEDGTIPAAMAVPADTAAPRAGRKARKDARKDATVVVPTSGPNGGTDKDPPLLQPAGKRKRQVTDGVQESDNLNKPVKRSKATPASSSETRSKRHPQKNAQLPAARSPLPDRRVRNMHPVTPKGTRRSSAQVAADNAAKRAAEKRLLEEQIHLGEMAKQKFAEMQVYEERG